MEGDMWRIEELLVYHCANCTAILYLVHMAAGVWRSLDLRFLIFVDLPLFFLSLSVDSRLWCSGPR